MTCQTIPNCPNCLKIAKSKSQLFCSLEMNKVKLKNAILIGKVLAHDECIFGKRGINGACRKKTPPNLALWFGRYGLLKFTNW